MAPPKVAAGICWSRPSARAGSRFQRWRWWECGSGDQSGEKTIRHIIIHLLQSRATKIGATSGALTWGFVKKSLTNTHVLQRWSFGSPMCTLHIVIVLSSKRRDSNEQHVKLTQSSIEVGRVTDPQINWKLIRILFTSEKQN